jgi:hypothetical protein
MEKSSMICYADVGDFLRGMGYKTHFYGFEQGIEVSDWDYDLSRNNDILRFLMQKYPVSISSRLGVGRNIIRITFRDDWGK